MGRPRLSRERDRVFWSGVRGGLLVEAAAVAAGMSVSWGRRRFREAGGVNPFSAAAPVGRYLCWAEREEIAALVHQGARVGEIARALGRSAGTISRELARGSTSRGYRASVAQAKVDAGRSRPRAAKLATNLRLRREVETRLKRRESPEQIAGRLKDDFPEDPDRAVPGHWEGDLILGSAASGSAVGTLVERATGFVMLLHLPEDHTALSVQEALVAKMLTLHEQLRLSLTWDQGSEMSNHRAIADATGLEIYFCEPHSPWQRGSNENTNGLLRQYLPKGTDLSFHGPGLLDQIAAELNSRPRKRHAFRTPAEMLDKMLTKAINHTGVA